MPTGFTKSPATNIQTRPGDCAEGLFASIQQAAQENIRSQLSLPENLVGTMCAAPALGV